MRRFSILVAVVLAFAACDAAEEAAETGSNVVDACADLAKEDLCPVGTTVSFDASAVAECGGSAGGSVDVSSQSAEVSARCGSQGDCAFLCVPPSCCGGEEWTETSYKCDLPCAAACSCDGKCGTVTGVDCEADCGGCEGGQICGADNVCIDECPGGVASCGGDCCGTSEVCHENLCCDRVANCEGKSCGGDGCGGMCEDQDSIAGCEAGQTCDNGQCISDCSGSLDVCSKIGEEELVLTCGDSGKWEDGQNCALDGAFCVDTSTGATCAECSADNHCPEDSGFCLLTPTGAQCVACLQDEHCDDGSGGTWACEDGQCKSLCTPDCENDDGGPRNCGSDGCGGYCKDQDYTCNGTGKWCNPDNGQCNEDLAPCVFQYQEGGDGEWQQVVIPYDFPMCNSISPEFAGMLLDPEKAAEVVISGHVDMGDPDEIGKEPFENKCTWKIHEFEVDDGDDTTTETLNCSATDQVCSMLALEGGDGPVNPFQLFDSMLTIEDFQCVDKSTCADFGLEEAVPFCNFPGSPAYQESEEEGTLLACHQKSDLAVFKCEDCEDGESACSKDGWACFTQPANEDEGWPEQGFCAESQENACANGDIFPQCVTDQDGNPAISVCSWNPVTNEVEIETPETTCAEGEICVGYAWTDEEPTCDNDGNCDDPNMEDGFWHKPIAPSCQVAETCPSGGEQEPYCNDPAHPGHDPNYDPSHIMSCSVKLESNTVVYKPENPDDDPCSVVAGDPGWGLPGVCWISPEDGQVSCETDHSGQCDAVDQDGYKWFTSECSYYEDPADQWNFLIGPTTCTYDPQTNSSIIDNEPEPCPDGQICVPQELICNPQDPSQCTSETVDATCQEPAYCPDMEAPLETPCDEAAGGEPIGLPCTYCNVEGAAWYQESLDYGVISCMLDVSTNELQWHVVGSCNDGDTCFAGGKHEWLPFEETELQTEWLEPFCAEPEGCPEPSWCVGTSGGNTCEIDPQLNQQIVVPFECDASAAEACYTVNDNDPTDAYLGNFAEPGYTGQCISKPCGEPSPDGYQTACHGDINNPMTCFTPDGEPNGFDAGLWGEFGGTLPTYACLSETQCGTSGAFAWGDDFYTSGPGSEGDPDGFSTFVANAYVDPWGNDQVLFGHHSESIVDFVLQCHEIGDGPVKELIYKIDPEHAPYMDHPDSHEGVSNVYSTITCAASFPSSYTVGCCACAWSNGSGEQGTPKQLDCQEWNCPTLE